MKKSIIFSSLILEVTRRCNMNCRHCLRGGAENLDVPKRIMDRLLKPDINFQEICFSGGEPSLNPSAIRYMTDGIIRTRKSLSGFYLVTNGKKYSPEMMTALIDLYGYTMSEYGEDEVCGLALSKDPWHSEIPKINEYRLRAMNFFREDKMYSTDVSLIDEGRAHVNKMGSREAYADYAVRVENEEIYVESDIYINVRGDIVTGCDFSYRNQEKHKIGNIMDPDLEKVFEKAAKNSIAA